MPDDNNNNNGPYVGSEENVTTGRTYFNVDENSSASPGDYYRAAKEEFSDAGYDASKLSLRKMREMLDTNVQTLSRLTSHINQSAKNIQSLPEGEEKESRLRELRTRQDALRTLLPEAPSSPFSRLYAPRMKLEAALNPISGEEPEETPEQRARRELKESISKTESRIRFFRAQNKSGSELGYSDRQEIEKLRDENQRIFEEQTERYRTASDEGTKQEASLIVKKAADNVSALEKILSKSSEEQSNSLNNTLGFVSQVLSTLAVGQLATQFAIQDPFQYQTMPALQAAGQTSDAGAVLSEALIAAEQYDVSLNARASSIGQAAMFSGAALRGRLGLGLGLAGGALTGLGLTGLGDELFKNIPFIGAQDDVLENQLARSVINASPISEYYTSSRAGLLQAGAGPNLGFSGDASGGNYYLNDLITRNDTALGVNLQSLGMDEQEAGRRLTAASMQLRGSGRDLDRAVETTAVMETLYGVAPQATLGNLASIQRAGVDPSNYINTFYQSMGAVADEDGNVSNFAANVLVPALNQVLESTAIQNAARSSEELTREVYGFRQTLAGDDRLGELLDANPEVFNRIYADMQQNIKQGARDPATFAFFRSLGLSNEQIFGGSPEVAVDALNFLRQTLGSAGTSIEDILPIASMVADSGLAGIGDTQTVAQLLVREEDLRLRDIQAARGEGEEGEGEVGGRDISSQPADLLAVLSNQAIGNSELNQAFISAKDSVLEFQAEMNQFLSSDGFQSLIDKGLENLEEEIRNLRLDLPSTSVEEAETSSSITSDQQTEVLDFVSDFDLGLTEQQKRQLGSALRPGDFNRRGELYPRIESKIVEIIEDGWDGMDPERFKFLDPSSGGQGNEPQTSLNEEGTNFSQQARIVQSGERVLVEIIDGNSEQMAALREFNLNTAT